MGCLKEEMLCRKKSLILCMVYGKLTMFQYKLGLLIEAGSILQAGGSRALVVTEAVGACIRSFTVSARSA